MPLSRDGEAGRTVRHGLIGHARRAPIVLIATLLSCVSYDAAGPPVPSIDGTYAAELEIDYINYLETQIDTVVASITVRDTRYRGQFAGAYRIADDSGSFNGAMRPESTLLVTEFGAPPTPLSNVATVRRLFPWCDFSRLVAAPLSGQLQGDSLLIFGGGLLPCAYHLFGRIQEIETGLYVHIRGAR